MMSEFWQRKIKTYFRRLDYNGDGVLTKEDCELIIDRFCELNGTVGDRVHLIRKKVIELFEIYTKPNGEGGKLTEPVLIEALIKHRDEIAEKLQDVAEMDFLIMDGNGDGFIDESEYIKFFDVLSITDYESAAKVAFRAMDQNHDGLLSMNEFKVAVQDFMFSDDENGVGALWCGPLI